jgi:hypothetical protein
MDKSSTTAELRLCHPRTENCQIVSYPMYRDYDARSYNSQGCILVWEHTAATSIKQIHALTASSSVFSMLRHFLFLFFIFLGKFIFLKTGTLLLCSVTLTGPRTPIQWIKTIHVHISGFRLSLWTAATNGPIVHLPGVTYENTEPWRNDTTGENQRAWRKTCPSASLSTTNPTWTDLGANRGLCSERPAPNCFEPWNGLQSSII